MLLRFWDQAGITRVPQLLSKLSNLKNYRKSFSKWSTARSFLNISARPDFVVNRFARRHGSELHWSWVFKDKLDTWKQETKELSKLFSSLPGFDFVITNRGRDILITPSVVDEIYDAILSYPAQCEDEQHVIKGLGETEIIGSADWTCLEKKVQFSLTGWRELYRTVRELL